MKFLKGGSSLSIRSIHCSNWAVISESNEVLSTKRLLITIYDYLNEAAVIRFLELQYENLHPTKAIVSSMDERL